MKTFSDLNFCSVCGKKTHWQIQSVDEPGIIWVEVSCCDCQEVAVVKAKIAQVGYDEGQ